MAEEKVASEQEPVNAKTEWQDRATWELQARVNMRKEYEGLFEIWKEKELVKLAADQEVMIREGLEKLVTKAQEDQKPPTDVELQQVLDKEYLTFTVPVDYYDSESDKHKNETFTIRELPQSIEKQFYRQLKDKIIGKAQMLEAFTQAGMDKPFEEKAKAFLELFDESFDMLADAVLLCLDPFGRKKLTKEWIQDNIGSDRQWRIVETQIEVNRLRDFFSKVSQSGQRTMTTMRAPNFQQLQQLVR